MNQIITIHKGEKSRGASLRQLVSFVSMYLSVFKAKFSAYENDKGKNMKGLAKLQEASDRVSSLKSKSEEQVE